MTVETWPIEPPQKLTNWQYFLYPEEILFRNCAAIINHNFHCPNCGNDYKCPCNSCTKRRNGEKNTWSFVNGDYEMCLKCGLTMHADGWLDEEWKQMERVTKIGSFTGSIDLFQKVRKHEGLKITNKSIPNGYVIRE